MTDLSKIKDGAFENGIPEDTDFEQFEARSLAHGYGLAEAIEAAGYAEAGLEVPRQLEVIESEILFYKAQAGGAILEIGRRLLEAKEQVPHGQWETWLAEKVDFSVRSAQRFMKLAKGYGESDTVALLGARKALVLLALEDSERSDFLEENDAQNMSAKELEEAVRQRKEAQAEAQRLTDELKAQKARNSAAEAEKLAALNKASMAEEAKKRAEGDLQAAKAREKTQVSAAEASKKEADKLRSELDALKRKPVEVAVREPTEEEIAKHSAGAVEKALMLPRAEIERLKKELAAADPYTAAFKVRFEEWQLAWQKMTEALDQVAAANPEKADKLRSAIRAALEGMGT